MKDNLWGGRSDPLLDSYTVGEDRSWDRRLLRWDILATIAHVQGLAEAGLLGAGEERRLVAALRRALALAARGELAVGEGDEDVHTALERHLAGRLGALGEKVHAGRSRNDQVLADLRLYTKDRIIAVAGGVRAAAAALLALARRHARVLLPGYTHLRRAMPSTVGLWAGAHAEALLEGLEPLEAAYRLVDRCPLGSGAGYGVPLPLPRARTARRLGFAATAHLVTAAQGGRGREEVLILAALWGVARDLGRLSWDVILFAAEEFGFLRLAPDLATGSSIMPQKRNPDLFELTRAREGLMAGYLAQAAALAGKLPGGYHRDLQLLKGPLFRGFDTLEEMLALIAWAVPGITVDRERCRAAVTGDLLATDEACRRVQAGVPFRQAYREVAAAVRGGEPPPPLTAARILAARRGPGEAGRPELLVLGRRLAAEGRRWDRLAAPFLSAQAELAGRKRARRR